MRPALRKFYADSLARQVCPPEPRTGRTDCIGRRWCCLIVESLWAAGEMELVSDVIQTIAERVYTSMDRRSVANPSAEGKPLADC